MTNITDLQTEFVRVSATHSAITSAKTLLEDVLAKLNAAQGQNAATMADLQASLKAAQSVYGEYSATDQVLRTERFAGKAASIDYVKAHPDCNEADAIAEWTTAALAATGRAKLFQDPAEFGALYRSQLKAAGGTPDESWEAQRAWIVATDKDAVLGL